MGRGGSGDSSARSASFKKSCIIHFKLDLEQRIKELQGGTFDPCGFAAIVQELFDCEMAFGGTRESLLAKEPKKWVDFLRGLFLFNREWRPYEVRYAHGSPDAAKLSDEDQRASFTGYDDAIAEAAAAADASAP